MVWIRRLEMKSLWWICWMFLPRVLSFPVTSTGFNEKQLWISQDRFRIVFLSVGAIIITVICALGCLCCKKHRRISKGFQEFKDGSGAGSETIIERGLGGLELEVPRSTSTNRVQFDPLPVERILPESKVAGKPKPPSPSLFSNREFQEDHSSANREWFSPDLHVSRERLKYLREIGRGWFGKIVEGTQDLESGNVASKTRGIIVRILTEEASVSEKNWFLGESLPYLKLHHRNILKLFGACLETDPYLLLFESCPNGDLKAFLQTNKDSEALISENIPLRMALDISAALEHMNRHGFAHTDLSARNCLVAPDLSAKLGDYGIGVEKYPGDYYVVGDRALPIRWSAPESLICTETTIETRAITPLANLWSFSILLWEIASWGERPYDNLGDEQVIEMIHASKFESNLRVKNLNTKLPCLIEAMYSCWKYSPDERASLEEIRKILRNNILADFEQRWETLKVNTKGLGRSSSLKELRESMDSDLWHGGLETKPSNTLQAAFRLGPEEPIMNQNALMAKNESGSETEEESWRGRVERGAYTEKVKQKSKSVADLMVLVHIDSDSEAEWSLGPQIIEKLPRKRIPTTGSVGDLRSSILADEFGETLRKLRDPINDSLQDNKYVDESLNKVSENALVKDQSQKYNLDCTSTPKKSEDMTNIYPNNFVDVELWKNALEFELERKIPGFDVETVDFDDFVVNERQSTSVPGSIATLTSASDTPQSRGEDFSGENEDFSNSEDVDTEKRKSPNVEDEEDRKHLSTPDDERSSDSGFRDKESCEEEENPISAVIASLSGALSTNILPTMSHSSTEEEQLKILYELDSILDAEYSGSFEDDQSPLSPSKLKVELIEINTSEKSPESSVSVIENEIKNNKITEKVQQQQQQQLEKDINVVDKELVDNKLEDVAEICTKSKESEPSSSEPKEYNIENDDEDSSTMSLRSDNSYVSFNLDEEFVAAIRNELREKLPHAQLAIVETPELHDDDDDGETPVNAQLLTQNKTWEEDDELSDNESGNIDIAIRYNIYGTPLSPILEERESAMNSEMTIVSREDSGDLSETSKLSTLPEDVLIVDTKTNRALMIDHHSVTIADDDHDTINGDLSDEECVGFSVNNSMNRGNNEKSRSTSRAPLPSPEEESKWQAQFPISHQLHDDLMSTSFSTEHDWDSQDDDEEGGGEDPAEEDDEENSSSSGEFVWKRYDDPSNERERENRRPDESRHELGGRIDEEENEDDDDDDDDDEEEEFTPSAWDATLAPHRSALRSPEKTLKSGDQKKNVWFKKQRYHCVYEYPKETPAADCQSQAATTWEPTSYADWEEMMDEPKVDVYSIDYDESSFSGDEQFSVSSGNRPFQFQAGDGKYVSQFFPGASSEITSVEQDEPAKTSQVEEKSQDMNGQNDNQQTQLGELRHTRDRLKLNLSINNGAEPTTNPTIAGEFENSETDRTRNENDIDEIEIKENNNSESSTSKNEMSLDKLSFKISEISRGEDSKSLEDNSVDEISDLETSEVVNLPKSSKRPLVIVSKENRTEENAENNYSSVLNDTRDISAVEATQLQNSNDETTINEKIAVSASGERTIEHSECKEIPKSFEIPDKSFEKSIKLQDEEK